jgi:hypothetical protein
VFIADIASSINPSTHNARIELFWDAVSERTNEGSGKKASQSSKKRQTKRQSNGFSRKYRTFFVNVLQGGNTLVRWVKHLSVGSNICPLGLRIRPLVCLFAAFFSQESSKKKPWPFFRRPRTNQDRTKNKKALSIIPIKVFLSPLRYVD